METTGYIMAEVNLLQACTKVINLQNERNWISKLRVNCE